MLRRIIFIAACLLLSSFTVLSQNEAPADNYLRADRFGITFISSVDIPHSDERYQRALELGAGWNRWPLYWDRVEPQPGEFAWEAYDTLLETDQRYGLKNNVILLGLPEFYRNGQSIMRLHEGIFEDGSDTPRPGKGINPNNPWAVYVQNSVQRYMPGGTLAQEKGWNADQGVRVWEIWNEPDFSMFWQGGVYDYARMLKTAYIVIKQLDPQATVMMGGLLFPTSNNWLAQVLGIYINDPFHETYNWYMDAIAIHSYGNAWRSGWLTLYVRQTLIEFQIDRPIWLNESGVAVWDDYPGPTWTTTTPEERPSRASAAQQAAFLIQSSAYAWAEGAQTVFFHQLFDDCGDQPPGTNFPPHDGELCTGDKPCFGDAFGLYRNTGDSVCYSNHPNAGTARPVAEAYKLLTRVFGAIPFSRRGVVEEWLEGRAVAITFTRPSTDERVVVLWNTTQSALSFDFPAQSDVAQVYTLDGERTIRPLDGNYALYLPAAETPMQRSFSAGGTIDIGGEPLILIEKLAAEAAEDLEQRTFAAEPTPVPSITPIPEAYYSDEQIEELQEASPTGVIFISLNTSRMRNFPSTENSAVVGTIPPNNTASVVGRTEDGGWLQIDYNDQLVWVASFLGEVHGDLDDVPVIAPQDLQGE